jgi:very-short-patch-repair endonuclease
MSFVEIDLAGLSLSGKLRLAIFFAGFVCREKKLIVEVDGGTHSTPAERVADASRTEALCELGYRFFRAHNSEIFENLDGVLNSLLAELRI